MKRISLFWVQFLVFSFLMLPTMVFSAASITGTVPHPVRVAPVGASSSSPTQYNMFQLRVSASETSETLKSIQLRNRASNVTFGAGIARVRVFHDSDGVTGFDATNDEVVAQRVFGTTLTPGNVTLDFSSEINTIEAGSTSTYFIVYDINHNAPLLIGGENTTTNMEIVSVETQTSPATFATSTTSNVVTLTGFNVLTVEDVAPDVVLPGQDKVPMLKVNLQVVGENMTNDTFIQINNELLNLSPTSNAEAGVKRVHLYWRDPSREDINAEFNKDRDLVLQTLDRNSFSSSGVAVFDNLREPNNPGSGFVFTDTETYILFVVYDIGTDFKVEEETEFNADLVSFTGTGQQSGLTMTGVVPSLDPASSFVAGLTFDSAQTQQIVPPGEVFGQGIGIPMMQFVLRANHTDITMNRIVLNNLDTSNLTRDATFPYISNSFGTQGISKVQVFEDSNQNQVFDGVNAGDNLIAEVTLGVGNTPKEVTLPLNADLLIRTFDEEESYPANNERNFFIMYHTGTGDIVPRADASGNVRARASAFVKNVRGVANVSSQVVTINVSGSVPFTSNPVAFVDLQQTNLYLVSATNIAPSVSVLQGEIKVPVLAVNIQSDLQGAQIASSSMVIQNAIATGLNRFSGINQGISRVWVYRDENADGLLDGADTLLSSKRIEVSDSASLATLTSLPFSVDTLHRFLVLYDIGQQAVVTTNSAQAQFSGIFAGDDSEVDILFGGDLPAPAVPSFISVASKKLSMGAIDISQHTQHTASSPKWNVAIPITNLSGDTITFVQNGPDVRVFPKFYLANIGGTDISSEFTVSAPAVDTTIGPFETMLTSFVVDLSNHISQGTVIVDGYLEYVAPSGGTALLNRYFASSQAWVPASSQTGSLSLGTPSTSTSRFPTYVESVDIISDNVEKSFQDRTSIRPGSNMRIQFVNAGASIDEGSLLVKVNGITFPRRSSSLESISSGTFSYDETLGTLTVQNLGTSDGVLTLELTDQEGNALETLELTFLISATQVKLNRMLFYPNPYRISDSSALELGFDLSREAELKVYIYDYRGQKVYEEIHQGQVGYQSLLFPSDSSFLKSGMYICRVIATDADGNKSVATTKLAIY